MFFTLFEVGVVAILSIYLGVSQIKIRRRQEAAWDILVKQLEVNGIASTLCTPSLPGDQEASPEGRKWRIQGARDLWSMYDGARTMLEMANFAAANGTNVDPELLNELRRDAMQISICVVAELSKQTCARFTLGTCENVARAAELYTSMVSRMADILQDSSGMLAPASVTAA